MKTSRHPLRFMLQGFDERSSKTMQMFLQGPCRAAAIIVNDQHTADILVFDADVPGSKVLLDNHLQSTSASLVIVMSLFEFFHESIIHLKKPVALDEMIQAIDKAKAIVAQSRSEHKNGKQQGDVGIDNNPAKLQNLLLFPAVNGRTANAPEKLEDNSDVGRDEVGVKEEDVLKMLEDWFDF